MVCTAQAYNIKTKMLKPVCIKMRILQTTQMNLLMQEVTKG